MTVVRNKNIFLISKLPALDKELSLEDLGMFYFISSFGEDGIDNLMFDESRREIIKRLEDKKYIESLE